MLKQNKKYDCVFCSDTSQKSKHKINFCRDCAKIREHIRQYGITSILEKLTIIKASAPPQYPCGLE